MKIGAVNTTASQNASAKSGTENAKPSPQAGASVEQIKRPVLVFVPIFGGASNSPGLEDKLFNEMTMLNKAGTDFISPMVCENHIRPDSEVVLVVPNEKAANKVSEKKEQLSSESVSMISGVIDGNLKSFQSLKGDFAKHFKESIFSSQKDAKEYKESFGKFCAAFDHSDISEMKSASDRMMKISGKTESKTCSTLCKKTEELREKAVNMKRMLPLPTGYDKLKIRTTSDADVQRELKKKPADRPEIRIGTNHGCSDEPTMTALDVTAQVYYTNIKVAKCMAQSGIPLDTQLFTSYHCGGADLGEDQTETFGQNMANAERKSGFFSKELQQTAVHGHVVELPHMYPQLLKTTQDLPLVELDDHTIVSGRGQTVNYKPSVKE
jgi:hypothetical protein